MGVQVAPFGVDGKDLPYFPLVSEPGDLIVFNQNLWHGVFNAGPGRRFIVLKFASKPTENWHVKELTRYKQDVLSPDNRWLNSKFPRIRGMVQQLADIGEEANSKKWFEE
jgi:hypothetical protein